MSVMQNKGFPHTRSSLEPDRRMASRKDALTQGYLKAFFLFALIGVGWLVFAQNRNAEISAAMERARQDLTQHNLQKAVQEYADILKLDPRNAEIYTADGVALYGLGRTRQAMEALQTALSIDPGQGTAELFLGLSKSDLGQCDKAIPLLQKHFSPQTAPHLRRVVGISLLSCYRETAQFKEALGLAQTLKSAFPTDADILYNLAELYTQLWDVTASELLKDHPESYRVHQLAGEVLEAQGKYDRAIKEYLLALKEKPEIPGLRYRIGKMVFDQGGPGADDRAMIYFKQELQINPDNPAPQYSMAEIFRRERRFADAEQRYRQAIQMSPGFVAAYIGLGRVFLQEHQLEAAQREMEKAIQLRPDNPTAHYELMMIDRDLGKTDEAAKEMAIFQKLNLNKQQDFKSRLRALLTGKNADSQPSQ
jgi:tetratricopeptide (TPR) repeat protein